MIDTQFKSEQNQFLHLDTETILSAPLYILLESHSILTMWTHSIKTTIRIYVDALINGDRDQHI